MSPHINLYHVPHTTPCISGKYRSHDLNKSEKISSVKAMLDTFDMIPLEAHKTERKKGACY